MIKTTGNTSSATSSKSRSALGGNYTYSNALNDFDVAVVNGTRQLQITNAPHTLLARNIVAADKIMQIVTSTHEVLYVDTSMVHVSEASGTYTVTLSGMTNTFSTGDDVIVNIAWPNKNRDSDLDADKVILQNPPSEQYTAPEAYDITATVADYVEGAVIDVRGYNTLNYMFNLDSATGGDLNLLKVSFLAKVDGAEDYQESSEAVSAGTATMSGKVYQYASSADIVQALSIPTNGMPFMRIDAGKSANLGDDAEFKGFIQKARN